MPDLMSIGRFSRLTGLTVKALRLYDRLGLLQPAVVDLSSGYRYYSPSQMHVARAICLMRSTRMPLADIQALLDTDDRERLEERLAQHRRSIESRLEEYQQALARVPTVDEWCKRTGKGKTMESETYKCSFCSKERSEVRRMIAGPNRVYICSECVTLCNEIIDREETEALPVRA